ncbi:hypothetical protein EI94DRAFT_1707719 [Lactarius quietus]|nr:hypothetical protein EI94DRAFT_1707719 [Lactarius quietus]
MEEAKELEAGEVVVKDEDVDDDAKLNTIENAIQVTEAEEKAAIEGGDLGMARPQMLAHGSTTNLPKKKRVRINHTRKDVNLDVSLVEFDLKSTLSCSSLSAFSFKDDSACLAVLATSENATLLARITLRSNELSHSRDFGLEHMTVASMGLAELSVMWRGSLEEKVIGKVILNKWGRGLLELLLGVLQSLLGPLKSMQMR